MTPESLTEPRPCPTCGDLFARATNGEPSATVRTCLNVDQAYEIECLGALHVHWPEVDHAEGRSNRRVTLVCAAELSRPNAAAIR